MQRSDLRPGFSSGKAGAKDAQLVSPRCGNPRLRRETGQVGCCLGKFVTLSVFAQRIAFRFVLPQENGLPRRFAPRNDMQKSAGRLRLQERSTRGNAQKVRIRRRYFLFVLSYRRRTDCRVASLLAMTVGEVPSRPTSVHPQTRARLQHVIVNNVLATADTWQVSACHCEQRSCNRRHLANFCMSLRTSAHTGVAIRVPAEKPGKLAAV